MVVMFGLIASKSARILADIQRQVLAAEGRALLTYGDIGEQVFGWRGVCVCLRWTRFTFLFWIYYLFKLERIFGRIFELIGPD
jgi:hypothetical protein